MIFQLWNPITLNLASVKSTTLTVQYWRDTCGSRRLRRREFLDSRHMMVLRFTTLYTGRLYPQGRFLVLISVRGWVDPRALVRPEEWSQREIPKTTSGVEPATLGPVWVGAENLTPLGLLLFSCTMFVFHSYLVLCLDGPAFWLLSLLTTRNTNIHAPGGIRTQRAIGLRFST